MTATVGEQLPILVKPPYPMLARVGNETQLATAVANNYQIEPKLDGMRCLVTVDNVGDHRVIRLFNRNLGEITSRFPDVVDSIRLRLMGSGMTLDGEIYVAGEDGLPNFQLAQTRVTRVRDIKAMIGKYPARYSAFDILRVHGVPIMGWRLVERRVALMEVIPQLAIATYTQDEANDLATRQVGEGLMLKHVSSRYDAGLRSPAWLKVKWLREIECVVGGVTWGIGRRADTFGGLLVGVPLPEDREGKGRLQYIGTVGTGFTNAQLANLIHHLQMLKTADCPFVERAADWDLRWFVRPVIRVKVAFAEYTRDGIMRFPRFVRVSALLAEKLP